MRSPITQALLRSAARDLGRLPEIVEAARIVRAGGGELTAAVNQVERAAEVVAGVPMPALQLVAGGALAQLLRATGRREREAAVWQDVLSKCSGDADPSFQLHALHGATSSQLHQGATEAALASCNQAATLISAQQGPSAVGWRATFGAHHSLALLLQLRLRGDADAAADELPAQLQAQLEARREEMESVRSKAGAVAGAGGDADAAAAFQVASAAVEGTHLLLGDAYHLAGNGAEAQESWRAVLPAAAAAGNMEGQGGGGEGGPGETALEGPEWSAALTPSADHARAMREIGARVRLGTALIADREVPNARKELAAAVDCCEAKLPASHPLLPYAVGQLAAAVAAEGEFMTAEGLYRSSIGSLDPQGNALPAAHVPLLLPSLHAFADLLERLETNGKPRTAEAEQMRARADAVRAAHAEALPSADVIQRSMVGRRGGGGAGAGAGGGAATPWLGLEPWYAASSEVDWLGACLAAEE